MIPRTAADLHFGLMPADSCCCSRQQEEVNTASQPPHQNPIGCQGRRGTAATRDLLCSTTCLGRLARQPARSPWPVAPKCTSEWSISPSKRNWADHHTCSQLAGACFSLHPCLCPVAPDDSCILTGAVIEPAPNLTMPIEGAGCFSAATSLCLRGLWVGKGEEDAASRYPRCAFQLTSEQLRLA